MKAIETKIITILIIATGFISCNSKKDVSTWEMGNMKFSSIIKENILYDTLSTNNSSIELKKILF